MSWEANRVILERRFPQVAQRLRQAGSGAGEGWRARSAEDAAILTRRWLHGRRIRGRAVLAVSGWGDGSHLRALLGVLPEGSVIFVGEQDAGALRSALAAESAEDLLGDERVLLGVGAPDEDFFEPFTGAHATALTDVEPWVFAPCYNRDADYYARFFLEFARVVDFRRKLEGTRIVDAALWQKNSFLNLPLLADAPEIDALAGLFRGRPAVLVSAGPSLDESLDFLRAASSRAVIIGVNSSYRAMRRAGIVPHLVLAADPREFTLRGFAGVETAGTWLVTTPIVHPGVVELFRGRTFIWSGANQLFLELRRRMGLPPGISIVEQGTVSACGVDLAIIMGCDRICLVGQDLCVRDDGQSHATDSFYTDSNTNKVDTSACRRLPGNTRAEVLVEEKLYIYLKTFEQLAVHRKQAAFCNTARLGARIEGMPYRPFSEALAWLGDRSTAGALDALGKRHREGAGRSLGAERLRGQLGDLTAYAGECLQRALRAVARLESLKLAEIGAEAGGTAAVSEALAEVAGLRQWVEADKGNFSVLEGGVTRRELFRALNTELSLPAHLPPLERRVLAGREYAWAFAEGAWFLLNELEQACSGGRATLVNKP